MNIKLFTAINCILIISNLGITIAYFLLNKSDYKRSDKIFLITSIVLSGIILMANFAILYKTSSLLIDETQIRQPLTEETIQKKISSNIDNEGWINQETASHHISDEDSSLEWDSDEECITLQAKSHSTTSSDSAFSLDSVQENFSDTLHNRSYSI